MTAYSTIAYIVPLLVFRMKKASKEGPAPSNTRRHKPRRKACRSYLWCVSCIALSTFAADWNCSSIISWSHWQCLLLPGYT